MKTLNCRSIGIAVILSFPTTVCAQFEELWRLGEDDESQADFVQEGGVNDPPGDPFTADDDYYFPGEYPDPIGTVDEEEGWFNFERAVTSGDSNSRIHFTLDELQVHPLTKYRLSFDMYALGSGGGTSIHDLEFSFNGEVIDSETDIDTAQLFQSEVLAGDVNAEEGENIVEVVRTGGSDASWIQFDYVLMEIDTSQAGCEEAICLFTSSADAIEPGGAVTLTWVGLPDASFSIDNGIGDVSAQTSLGLGSMEVSPDATTTYTITATLPDSTMMTLSTTVTVNLITSFASSTSAVKEGDAATLSWMVHPDATLDLQPGIGEVDNDFGEGMVDVTPTEATTYTLTATLGDEMQTAEVTVLVSNFVRVWQLGDDNDSQSEFSQEGGVNPEPGSPTVRDDDYYFAGTYPDPIGTLEEDEPWINFERAVTSGDATVRVHFNLNEVQAHPDAVYRIGFDMILLGSAAGIEDIHDLEYRMNGEVIQEVTDIIEPVYVEAIVGASEVSATTEENIIEVTRTGQSDSSWIQFDYIQFEADTTAVGCSETLCGFTADTTSISPGQTVTLNWVAHPNAEVSIDPDLEIVTENGQGTIEVMPANNTTYTITATLDGDTVTREIPVRVRVIESFGADAVEVSPGEGFLLDWVVDPAATVVLEGIGPVDDDTIDGIGLYDIGAIGQTTTYTLTATRGADVETAMVTVGFNPYTVLWELGLDDNSQADFVQETGGHGPPGAPDAQDDDYYFAGSYEEIGDVEEDEEWALFERALTTGNQFSRIHFNLTDEFADPDTEFRLTYDLYGLGGSGESIHDLEARFNDNAIGELAEIQAPVLFQPVFTAADVDAVAGENFIEIERVGGTETSAWIQFDQIKLEALAGGSGGGLSGLRFTEIILNEDGSVELTWASRDGKSYLVQSTEDFSSWEELTDGLESEGETTSYTDSSGFPESGVRYYQVLEE